jgi:hypothetical protein
VNDAVKILITDNNAIYLKYSAEFKILFDQTILKTSFLKMEEVQILNRQISDLEPRFFEQVQAEMSPLVNQLKQEPLSVNRFLGTRSVEDQIFALLYDDFMSLIFKKYQFNGFLEILEKHLNSEGRKISRIEFYLKENSLFVQDLFKENNTFNFNVQFCFPPLPLSSIPLWKNLSYACYAKLRLLRRKRQVKEPGVTHILAVLYDIKHHYELLETFFELVKADKKVELTILNVRLGGLNRPEFDPASFCASTNIHLIQYSDYRCPVYEEHEDLFRVLEKENVLFKKVKRFCALNYLEHHYAWMNQVFEDLKPDVCLNIGYHTIGRAMSDVARYYKIPSNNLEYAIPLSKNKLENNIQFDNRICISHATRMIWEKRKDPSLNHPIIGYCKFDKINAVSESKSSFYERIGLDSKKKTLFFASTWGYETDFVNIEKGLVMSGLLKMCKSNDWNLIIKKHPLENDFIAEESIQDGNSSFAKVFKHHELDVNVAITHSDFVCNQLSSIILETIYFEKPFCFIHLGSTKMESDFSAYNESFAPVFASMEEVNEYAKKIFGSEALYHSVVQQLKDHKLEYIYKSDGKASERLKGILVPTKH